MKDKLKDTRNTRDIKSFQSPIAIKTKMSTILRIVLAIALSLNTLALAANDKKEVKTMTCQEALLTTYNTINDTNLPTEEHVATEESLQAGLNFIAPLTATSLLSTAIRSALISSQVNTDYLEATLEHISRGNLPPKEFLDLIEAVVSALPTALPDMQLNQMEVVEHYRR